jgi:hypothetical protein
MSGQNSFLQLIKIAVLVEKYGRPSSEAFGLILPAARCPETVRTKPIFKFRIANSQFRICQVDMMAPGAVQLLAPVLPPMARART